MYRSPEEEVAEAENYIYRVFREYGEVGVCVKEGSMVGWVVRPKRSRTLFLHYDSDRREISRAQLIELVAAAQLEAALGL